MTASKALEQLQWVLEPLKGLAMFEGHELLCPESPGMDGDTPLHFASMDGQLDLLAKLLPYVSNINVSGDLGNTPLHCAVLWGRLDVAYLLLANGADILRANDYGDTPIGLMRSRNHFTQIVEEHNRAGTDK